MGETLGKYDSWLTGEDGPAALVILEHLMPVEGIDGTIFPPTFAGGDGLPGGYNIDTFGDDQDGKNVCLIDSVGSQANRIEPMFSESRYASLIPQIVVLVGDEHVNLLEAGHRAGDALVRCSELQQELHEAFQALIKGDAEPLAKIAPTSLVFGVWDSRDTHAKFPRLVSSVIRAYDVRRMTRGAVYIPPVDYSQFDVFSESDTAKAVGNKKSPLAQRGFVHNPASGTHGGVIATGGIRRHATLSLAALHLLRTREEDRAIVLRRYVLGLALVALTKPMSSYLRQGCNLVIDPDQSHEFFEVYRDGRREPATISHEDAVEFASAASAAFGVGKSRTVQFDKKKAKDDVKKKD